MHIDTEYIAASMIIYMHNIVIYIASYHACMHVYNLLSGHEINISYLYYWFPAGSDLKSRRKILSYIIAITLIIKLYS